MMEVNIYTMQPTWFTVKLEEGKNYFKQSVNGKTSYLMVELKNSCFKSIELTIREKGTIIREYHVFAYEYVFSTRHKVETCSPEEFNTKLKNAIKKLK